MDIQVPNHRRPGQRSPIPPISPDRFAAEKNVQRPGSSSSDTSSNATSLSVAKQSLPYRAPNLPSFISTDLPRGNSSNASLSARPSPQYLQNTQDGPLRRASPLGPPLELQKHRPRQHSQGFFEPSLPSASLTDHSNMAGLTASQIAAQAAMQHQTMASHIRKRSSTVPNPQDHGGSESLRGSKSSSPPIQAPHDPQQAAREQLYRNGLVGTTAAARAANAAFPRSSTPAWDGHEKETKKVSKMKLFKPKHIGITRDKDKEAKDKPLPSPNKIMVNPSGLSRVVNASTTSLADTHSSNNSSMYNLNNASSSTMIPAGAERTTNFEREKPPKHHGLRQKLKLKDKDDHHNLPLSSANSNSRPLDTNNAQSLYSFAPSSPGLNSAFSKSVSGLDLRHGGRALREKKKEEKANASSNALEQVYSRGETESSEWPSMSNLNVSSSFGTSLGHTPTGGSHTNLTPYTNDPATQQILSSFGVHHMTPDDAWDLLKAKVLVIFEGEDVKQPIEDLNRLVTIHIQRCVQKRAPSIVIEDIDDLFQTGFLSLNHTLRSVPDDRLVPHLVNMWLFVFGTVLPFMQAVFLPLDLEFKGKGTVFTTPSAAAEFWGIMPLTGTNNVFLSSPVDGQDMITPTGDELEVRRTLLISFRDTIILPRYDNLKATFSRLSLDAINAELVGMSTAPNNTNTSERPATAQTLDPTYASYNSQSSTLLGSSSSAARSRAASNVSNPAQDIAFQSFSSPPAARPTDTTSSQVTETVGRMLQCVSVLASVQSGDEAQGKMEELGKQLKLNWLGRGRTGRNRRGFVGSRVRGPPESIETIRDNREGSPTPTPTRVGTAKESKRTAEDGGAGSRSLL